jgi:hypothetical protein
MIEYIEHLKKLENRCRSEHIDKQKFRHLKTFSLKTQIIAEHETLVLIADIADYRTIVHAGHWSWYSCNCTGYIYNKRCIHIKQLISKVLADIEKNPLLKTKGLKISIKHSSLGE